ncbi:hypothetical protein SAMN05428950_101897 [Sphingomonas sp. OV641]|uniref:hypothetical protein n=1 Tax=Sphingomonas sp. OV641 TaxID=1881068 RepID=UPI0008C6268C|nr:hypothetical protein [Sphingomonas sp. OV641]SEJ02916.1 hypothetical protein SAMN05428950_101897 [Sphingomonas sp. OV641]
MVLLDDDDQLRCTQQDVLVLHYQECFSDGTPRGMEGQKLAFTVFGPGVGKALGRAADAVTVASVLRTNVSEGRLLEMRHDPEVTQKLAGHPNLRWRLAEVLGEGVLDTFMGGPLVIEPAPGATGTPASTSSDSDALLIRVRPEYDFLPQSG